MSDLFDPGGTRIYSIPAGADFLGGLARGLADEFRLADHPDALADALIYVPNRRSERALAFEIHRAAGGRAVILPDIRALGDLETSDPPPSAEAALADLPPVVSPADRLGRLTRLVMAYFAANDAAMPAVSCLAAARELARLLDQAALSGGVDWSGLETLAPVELAIHWKQSVKFLEIITEQWPLELNEMTALDPYARRLAAAEAMTEQWATTPPKGPVIIAGSTGATPASRLLIAATLLLPNGLVVLPGLDLELTDLVLQQVLETPSHPQFALINALQSMGLKPAAVSLWPHLTEARDLSARRQLVQQALAPAQSTADWTSNIAEIAPNGDAPAFVRQALEGLSVVEASEESEEALVAALLLRETLETDAATAALITPDAGLARRVSATLTRWGIEVSPSAGQPLPQTDAGSLLLLIAAWAEDPSNPVALLAMLNYPYCKVDRRELLQLDLRLRGPRLWTDWRGLLAHANAPEWLDSLSEKASAFERLSNQAIAGADWYQNLTSVADILCAAPHPWVGEDGAALSKLFQELAVLAGPLGAQPPITWNELFKAEAQLQAVAGGATHPRLAIWGPLEARLQSADRVILAGLNEEVWPEQPPADAFLPRAFRKEIGLSDPDERIGLSAHDFAQLASAPNVTLLSSHRRDDKPAIASRWLWRLQTLARGALGSDAPEALQPAADHDPTNWLEALQEAPAPKMGFSAEPRPCPPIEARPSELSVTRIEQLVRDPYAIYCEYILGIRPLDPLNLPADVRARGTAIHSALERFELEEAPYTADAVLALIEHELKNSGVEDADLIALRDVRRQVCQDFIDWRSAMTSELEGTPYTERKGELDLDIANRKFTLKGTADRLDKKKQGGVAILDFKTGAPPSERQVRSGLSPQMPLQGLIAREGGYSEIGKREVEALTYVRFGTKFEVQEIGKPNTKARLDAKPVAEIIEAAEQGLIQLLTRFADPAHPYLSAPRPERVTYESAYSRLARRDEWTGLSTYD